jgi:uncharacterized membrane protein
MIEWHTVDAWTRAADRHSTAFGRALVLGGFAAPLFLWLAGLGIALSASRVSRRTPTADRKDAVVRAICRRGLEIFILAFLFRVQAFVVSPGSYPVSIFRVDILNVMGLAIVAAGLVWALGEAAAALVVWFGALAAAVALLTPIVRTAAIVEALPLWFQWYIRPAGDLTTFTLFPWSGFVFAGAACGVVLATIDTTQSERRVQIAFGVTGLVLVILGHYLSGRPAIYQRSEFWTSSPTWFAMRVGILMIALSALYALGELVRQPNRVSQPLERFGRSSLFVYWIHVELVYGYATWLMHGRLPLWATFTAYAAFSLLMYCAVVLRDRVVETWRTRPRARSAAQAATA